MITDEDVKVTVNGLLNASYKHIVPGEPLPTQIYRGVNVFEWEGQNQGGCFRHKHMFIKFNAIPEYCFDCFKISITPGNVVELIKLMIVFDKLQLPNDNTRKCLVESRDNIPGRYTGLIYCIGLEEALKVNEIIKKVLKEEVSSDIPVTIKRGCSEYGIAYPEYPKVIDGQTLMDYKEEWLEYEKIVDKEYVADAGNAMTDSHNQDEYTMQDGMTVAAWLMYASAIGDLSYLSLTGGNTLPALGNINRPPFNPT